MVTIRDIAKRAGVTHTTVSAVLNERYTVTQPKAVDRARRIRRIAEQLGYRPNTAARATRSGRFQRIGLILPYGRASYMPHGLLSGLTHALAEKGYQLAVSELPPPESDAEQLPHMLRELSIDGLINLLDPPNDDLRRMLAGLNIPMVWVNQKLDANCVYPDEIDGAFRLTRYLHAAGHRRIAYIDFIKTWERIHLDSDYDDQGADLSALRAICRPRANRDQPHYAYRDRREGYRRAMQQLGLEPHVSELQGACPFDQRAQVRQILAGSGRPTAVITPTSGRAVRIVRAAEAMGLRDPSDLTVASFSWGDSFPVELNLTLMVHDAAHLAQAAVQMITDRISNTGSTEPSRTVSGRLLIDQTIPRQAAGE